ncbi:MAG TPA: RNA-binding protein [Candidatus Dojkabacteria bacterium]|mgnify:FL=1|nr:RNA-binding protein [Candidatus Dojkabacteria bacterium]
MKLYLGNLPYSATEEDLKTLLAEYGELEEVVVIKDKFSGRSKGFGFATLVSEEMARKAIEELNGKDMDGRNIVVNESKPMESRPRRDFGGNRGGFGGRRDDNRRSY